MRVEWADDGKGDLQFVIHAETREERVLLRLFRQQHDNQRFFVHGWTFEDGAMGPSSFNFGTVKRICRMCASAASGGACTCS